MGRGGDARYLQANYQYQQYIPLNKQFTLAFNGDSGWGKGLGGPPFPVFKNFYGGGWVGARLRTGHLGPRRDRFAWAATARR
jgi:outer membrane protein insertion porin family